MRRDWRLSVPAGLRGRYYAWQDGQRRSALLAAYRDLPLWPADQGRPVLGYICFAGLGNRLRVHLLATAASLATQRKLLVRWPANDQCGCTFSDLFVADAGMEMGCAATPRVVGRAEARERPDGTPPWSCFEDSEAVFVLMDYDWQYVDEADIWRWVSGLVTDPIAALKPKQDVLAQVDAVCDGQSPAIGVHIRRGDFLTHTRSSPELSRVVAAVEAAKARYTTPPAVMVCSDGSPAELEPLLAQLGPDVVFRAGSVRDTPEGVREALVDMLVLARCDSLVLTTESSFGKMAALLGQVPGDRVTSV